MSSSPRYVQDVEEDLFNFDQVNVAHAPPAELLSPPAAPSAPRVVPVRPDPAEQPVPSSPVLRDANPPVPATGSTHGASESAGFRTSGISQAGTPDVAEQAEPSEPAPAPRAPIAVAAFAPVSAGATAQGTPLLATALAEPIAAPSTPSAGRPKYSTRRAGPTPGVWIVLAACLVLNLVLVGVCWRSLRSVQGVVVDVGHQVLATAGELRAEAQRDPRPAKAAAPIPEGSIVPQGMEAVERAAREIEQGHFYRARQQLYTLLSNIDRVEAAHRAQVELHARFQVAESWRRQGSDNAASATPWTGGSRP